MLNLPITKSDLDNAVKICVPDLGWLVRQDFENTKTSCSGSYRNNFDKVCMDIGGLTFLSCARKLGLLTVNRHQSRKFAVLSEKLKDQVNVYLSKMFLRLNTFHTIHFIHTFIMDNESAIKKCTTYLNSKGTMMNVKAANEHAERAGGTMKERVRAVWNTLPYKLTNTMNIHLVSYCMVNMFPKTNGIGSNRRER